MLTISCSGTRAEPRICHDARHARRQMQPAAVPADDLLVLLDDERPGPDQAHLAAQDVDELRQLVQRRLAQQAPDPRDAGSSAILNRPSVWLRAISAAFCASASTTIERNFSSPKRCPSRPTRS